MERKTTAGNGALRRRWLLVRKLCRANNPECDISTPSQGKRLINYPSPFAWRIVTSVDTIFEESIEGMMALNCTEGRVIHIILFLSIGQWFVKGHILRRGESAMLTHNLDSLDEKEILEFWFTELCSLSHQYVLQAPRIIWRMAWAEEESCIVEVDQDV